MILGLIVGFLLFCLAWNLVALEVNYRRAASMGIPLVRLPIDPLNILFQVFESHIWKVIDRSPVAIPLPSWTRYARRGWYLKDKASSHLRYGLIWALVTPCDIHILVCDPEAVHDVFARRNDFVRPNKMYSKSMYLTPNERKQLKVAQSFWRSMAQRFRQQTRQIGQDIERSSQPHLMRAPCRLCGLNRSARPRA